MVEKKLLYYAKHFTQYNRDTKKKYPDSTIQTAFISEIKYRKEGEDKEMLSIDIKLYDGKVVNAILQIPGQKKKNQEESKGKKKKSEEVEEEQV